MIKRFGFYFFNILLSISLVGCGVDPKNDTNNKDISVLKTPSLSLSASVAKDTIYASKSLQGLKISNSDIVYNDGGSLYRATKNGGLGADLDDDNQLIPYSGIPIKIDKSEITNYPSIEVSAVGVTGSANDEVCPNLFSYNKDAAVININSKLITALTICKVTINASSIENNKNYSSSANFEVVFNLTFAGYFSLNDKGALYIKKYTNLQSTDATSLVLKISQFLKDKENQNLNLNYDTKIFSDEDKFTSFDAITAVQTLNSLSIANTNLNNLNAIINLPNITSLDISGTKVDPKDLRLLARIPNLKSLSVRDLDIKDISNITKFLPNLEQLDISGNTKIENLDNIKNLKNLRVLRARSIGLKSLKQLENLTQISTLDIAGNDFSAIKPDEANILVNLYKLNSLDISYSKFPDSVLNNYFGFISASRLVSFINRNNFNRNVIGNCDKINMFPNDSKLINLINLEYLDISGNSCQTSSGIYKGLISTKALKNMNNLKTLNISNTAVSDLNDIKNLNIQNLILNEPDSYGNFDPSKGIMMTANRCHEVLGQNQKACNTLGSGSEKLVEFRTPGAQFWTVPANVTSVKIIGCSGANGGAGGGGGGAAGAIFGGSWGGSSWGGNGGNSGAVNDAGAVGGGSGQAGLLCYDQNNETVCVPTDRNHLDSWQHGGSGGSGGLGGITSFGNQNFSNPSQYILRDPNLSCVGGVSGSGGSGGTNSHISGLIGGPGGAGATPAYPYGWSSKIETYTVSVVPGQTIQINVGAGGAGGGGGAGGSKQNGGYYRGSHVGSPGSGGSSGSDGFIKIFYESL